MSDLGDWGVADNWNDERAGDLVVTSDDPINRPPHYTKGDIDCIDAIISASAGWPSWATPMASAAMKYIWRCFLKGRALHDLRKAQWYVNKLQEELLRRGYTED